VVGRPADMAALARGLGGQPESGGRGREEAEVERDGGERKPRHGRQGGREQSGRVSSLWLLSCFAQECRINSIPSLNS